MEGVLYLVLLCLEEEIEMREKTRSGEQKEFLLPFVVDQ